MDELIQYIRKHTSRGECQCGRCADKGPDRPAPKHSVNVHFFWVSAVGEPTKEELRALLERGYPNFERLQAGPCYIEIGGEIGDQQLALLLIGLGGLGGLWQVIIPETVGFTGEEASRMAGHGFVMPGGFQ